MSPDIEKGMRAIVSMLSLRTGILAANGFKEVCCITLHVVN